MKMDLKTREGIERVYEEHRRKHVLFINKGLDNTTKYQLKNLTKSQGETISLLLKLLAKRTTPEEELTNGEAV